MLATFVIGLREGLEAALIVGIIAAFLHRAGRPATLRLVWIGVLAAIGICLAVAAGLQLLSASLPQAQQEGLETIVAAIAVVTVTYMIVWMRRNAPSLRSELEASAGAALAAGTSTALVGMAFLAVLREGFETAVFLLAAFNASGSPLAAGFGALLGIGVAVGIGYGIYRGGVRINMGRFFRLTGFVLVLVAAGLVASALHTGHEAGWIDVGQTMVADFGGWARAGSIPSVLLTGVLGIQPRPTLIEAVGWLLYAIPLAWYVLRPVPRPQSRAGGPAAQPVPARQP